MCSVQFSRSLVSDYSSVAQSCLTLYDPMNCWTPGLAVHHQILEFTKITSIKSVMPSSHLILCHPLLLLPPIHPASESFPMSQHFTWGGQSTGVSALASFPPKNSQGWSPSEWTGWISLQSRGLSGVFSNTHSSKASILRCSAFFNSPTLTSIHDYRKNHSLD